MVHLASQLNKIKWGNNRRIWEKAYTQWEAKEETLWSEYRYNVGTMRY